MGTSEMRGLSLGIATVRLETGSSRPGEGPRSQSWFRSGFVTVTMTQTESTLLRSGATQGEERDGTGVESGSHQPGQGAGPEGRAGWGMVQLALSPGCRDEASRGPVAGGLSGLPRLRPPARVKTSAG